jgi:peptidoglycan glycosyltransferase
MPAKPAPRGELATEDGVFGMNAPISKLFVVIAIMFAFLIVWTSRWTVFNSKALNANPLNQRTLADEVKIQQGRIFAGDGRTILAKSVPAGGGTWKRVYPTGSLFAQVVGYHNALENQKAGLEESWLTQLEGKNQGLESVFGQTGGTQVGNDVYTSLDPAAQRVARTDLAGRAGAVVALDPRTGDVLALYSNPTYDDNHPLTSGSQLSYATQAYDPPGSTFKIVTAAAGIDSGRYTPDSLINGRSPIIDSGVPLANDAGEQYGEISLTDALTNSVNTVFAQVASNVGIPTMTRYMRRFGFYATPPIDLPPSQLVRSHVAGFTAGSRNEDIGRIGIGQGNLVVTPLQMAMVVSAVADAGRLMTPHIVSRVVDPTGQTVQTVAPSLYRQVVKASTANDLKQMMQKVVEEGTGQPAQLGNISVAGKTGTAQVGTTGSGLTEPWFVGLAPVAAPKVVVAVTVQRTQGGYGATVAAPIARDVMKTLLAEGK